MSLRNRPPHKNFNDEVAVICKDLSHRLHHLLERHEAYLINSAPVGHQGQPNDLNLNPFKRASTATLDFPSNCNTLLFDSSKVGVHSDSLIQVPTFPGWAEDIDAEGHRNYQESNPNPLKGSSATSAFSSICKRSLYESSKVGPHGDALTPVVTFPGCAEDVDAGNSKSPYVNPGPLEGSLAASANSSTNNSLLRESSVVGPHGDALTPVMDLSACLEDIDVGGPDRCSQLSDAPYRFRKTESVHELELRKHWNEVSMDAQMTAVKRLESYSHKEEDRPSRRKAIRMRPRSNVPTVEGTWTGVNGTCFEVIHPSNQIRTIWNLITLALIIADMLTIPMLVFGVGDGTPWEVFAWFCTLFWTADMVMSMRTGYFVGAKVEMRQRQILINYAKTWLVLDTLIVLFEWFSRFFNTLAPPGLIRTTRVVRVVRLVKLVRVAKMKDLVNEFAARINSNVVYLILRICFLTLILLVGAHFMACIWYGLGESASDGWTSYDLYAVRRNDSMGFVYWYVSSARWVISQLNGRTDMDERRNLGERGFTIVGGVLCAIVGQAVFISLITKAMLELESLYKEEKQKRMFVNEYLSHYPIPSVLERCVKAFAKEYKDVNIEKRKEGVVLSLLPAHLKTEVLYEVRRPFINAHPLLKFICGEFTLTSRRICQYVVLQVHAVREEVIFSSGDASVRMLMMDVGSLIYATCDVKKASIQHGTSMRSSSFVLSHADVERLSRGQWVAEASIWCEWRNKGTLTTDNRCCMLEIDAILFANEIRDCNDALPVCSVYAKTFIEYLSEQEEPSDLVKPFSMKEGQFSTVVQRPSHNAKHNSKKHPPDPSNVFKGDFPRQLPDRSLGDVSADLVKE